MRTQKITSVFAVGHQIMQHAYLTAHLMEKIGSSKVEDMVFHTFALL